MASNLELYIKYTVASEPTFLHRGSGILFTVDEYMPVDQTQRLYFSDEEAIAMVRSGAFLVSIDGGVTALPAEDGVNALTFSKKNNFSYRIIDQDVTIQIPVEQQMVLFGEMLLVGDLSVTGELAVIGS